MMSRPVFLGSLLLLFAPLCGCGGAEGERLVLTGSSTIAPLAAEIAKRFEAEHSGARVHVQTGGSSRGVADVCKGLADIGMVSRALKDEESGLHAFLVARDGVCLIIHADNPVKELTRAQIIGIYTGAIQNWSEVGGADAPITVINKAEGRSTLELFLSHFDLDNGRIEADVVIGDNEQGVKTVIGNPNAVGYVSIGTAQYDAEHGAPIRLLPMRRVAASVENVGNGSFPLARPLNFVTREPPTGLAREFLDFARSEQVHDLIEAQYFVPLAR